MAQGRTDAYGHFTLEGHTAEFTTIDPKVNIYHKCEHKKVCLLYWVRELGIEDAIDTFGIAVKVASSGALKWQKYLHLCAANYVWSRCCNSCRNVEKRSSGGSVFRPGKQSTFFCSQDCLTFPVFSEIVVSRHYTLAFFLAVPCKRHEELHSSGRAYVKTDVRGVNQKAFGY